jgi:hypothetical protein
MKNRNLIISCLTAIFLFSGTATAQRVVMDRADLAPDPEYTKLLGKLKGGDTAIDYKALRQAFARSGAPGSRGVDSKIRMKLAEAVKVKKYDEIASVSQEILKINFLDPNAHVYAATAYEALKDTKKYDYHQAVYLGLINSIVNGADGESTKTAYAVVSQDEIFAVLKAYELQRTASEPLTEGTSRYEVVTVTDKTNGAVSKVYFKMDLATRTAQAMMRQ